MRIIMEYINGIPVTVSEAMAPEEVALIITAHGGVRWTLDGGIEKLSQYQYDQIRKGLGNDISRVR